MASRGAHPFLVPIARFTNAATLVVLLTLLLLGTAVTAISWQTSTDATWSLGCDFARADIGSARVSGAACSRRCGATRGCSHFAYTLYQGGTCWLKGGTRPSLSRAIPSNKPGAMCGVMRSVSSRKCTATYEVGLQVFCSQSSRNVDVARLRVDGQVKTINGIRCSSRRSFEEVILPSRNAPFGGVITANVEVANKINKFIGGWTLRNKRIVSFRFGRPTTSGKSSQELCFRYGTDVLQTKSFSEPRTCMRCMIARREPWCSDEGPFAAGDTLSYKVWVIRTTRC